MQTEKQQP